MSYRFYPPRTTNFFSPGVPYLAGVRGLGDYASDMVAFESAWARYLTLVAAFEKAHAEYKAKCAAIDADYAGRARSYQEQLSRYQSQYATIKQANTEKALAIAKSYGLSLPQSFFDGGACISPAQRDAYSRNCQTVKGLMGLRGLGAADPDCGYKLLPLCNYPVAPVKPVKTAYPKAPVPPVAPSRPTPPVVTTTNNGGGTPGGGNPNSGGGPTTSIPLTPITTTSDDDGKKSGTMMNGLIIVAVLGGGYLVYRTLKKPKAA